jgi:hypothetical protein
LPKPAFASLCAKLFASSQMRRAVAGQIGEKLLVEFEAADATTAQAWLSENKLAPLWLLRIDFESTDGSLNEM